MAQVSCCLNGGNLLGWAVLRRLIFFLSVFVAPMATQLHSPDLKLLCVSLAPQHISGTCPQCTTPELSSVKSTFLQMWWQCCFSPLTLALSLILFYQAFSGNHTRKSAWDVLPDLSCSLSVSQRKRASLLGRDSPQLPSVSCELAGIMPGLFWPREGGAWEMCLNRCRGTQEFLTTSMLGALC